MKHILFYLLTITSILSCKTDSFSETERYFITDKDVYETNDNFELTVIIVPKNEEKIIRFYKTFSNLRIYFSIINKQKGIYSENNMQLKKYFVEGPSIFGNDEQYIAEHVISKQNPFKKTFIGKISELKNKIIIEIPELNTRKSFDKSKFDEYSEISIQGYCTPINAKNGTFEEFFIPKDIKILIE